MKAICKKTVMNFVEGEAYDVVENSTNTFTIKDNENNEVKFSKLYQEEHPNFRKYFDIK